ncbi:MAG: hypothetical protein JW902_06050 [Syntrophaceae bacterium]|nr:hypothetical protein [Syntrophaceae bacterium]
MKQIKNKRLYYVMTAVAGLLLLYQVDIAAGQGVIERSMQNTPLSSTAEGLPLPSNAVIEYMGADQLQADGNDVPDWNIICQLSDFDFVYTTRGVARRRKVFNGFKFQLAFMNAGKLSGAKDIPVKVTVLNAYDNILIKEKTQVIKNQNLRSGSWGQTTSIYINFALGSQMASDLSDVKLIVEVDPDNTLGEDKGRRGNNIISVHW